MSYTKGEWIVVEEIDTYDIEYRNDGGGGFILSIEKSHPDAEANAQLIAAAPKLLEMCKALRDYITKEHDSLGDMMYFSKDVVEQAKQAIAEAEKGC